ncbi:rRNA maturation RNase YbeY [Patescibacteria group bacterium]|nr:rRNA maturation RNase YbeY [Patescibacteria group bacterium]
MIIEVNKLVKSWISKKFYSLVLKQSARVLKACLPDRQAEKKIDNLSIALVSGQTIKKLNHQYRRINQVTDVLSFDDPPQIIICWPQLKKQAKEQKHSQKKELAILLIHGFLHILGHDHRRKTDRIKMEKMEAKILKLIK